MTSSNAIATAAVLALSTVPVFVQAQTQEQKEVMEPFFFDISQLEEIEWQPAGENGFAEGSFRKTLYRSSESSGGAVLRRHPAGVTEPRHYHTTAAHTLLVLEGKMTLDGVEIGPGHFYRFGPSVPHGPLVAIEDTIFLVTTEGPLDLHLGDPPTKADNDAHDEQ